MSANLVNFQDLIKYQRDDLDEYEYQLACLDLLGIDEIVVPRSDAQATLFERFCTFVNERYEAQRSVFLAGNLTEDDLEQHYPKVHSRMHQMMTCINVPDIDFRKED
jgi:DNA replication protein DnaC